jgi:hypothetical protein
VQITLSIRAFSIAFLLFVFASPAASTANATPLNSPATPNVVEGTVRTVDGRPVPGAVIRISGSTGAGRGTTMRAVTDARGNYRITVPLGHYNVDGVVDIAFDGKTYKEIWLDRGNAPCGRVMSNNGIVRHFVLRLSGRKRCFNVPDSNTPDAYNGAYVTAMTSAFPDDAVITFNLVPVGALADGSPGRTIVFKRTGAALKRGGGPIDETSFLHDIPLGRYRMTAAARYADGRTSETILELRDGGNVSGRVLDIVFVANVLGGGIRPVGVGVVVGRTLPPINKTAPEAAPAAPTSTSTPELPHGQYACSYRSPYAGDIPTGHSITIIEGGRYKAYGGEGTYKFDPATLTLSWRGPLGDGDVRATFGKQNGRPSITVIGGHASADLDRTHYCTLSVP